MGTTWPYDPHPLTLGYCRCTQPHGPGGHHRHNRPSWSRRLARAAARGAARALAAPLWPEHVLYMRLAGTTR